jgi:SAM-dependent methyltransferase
MHLHDLLERGNRGMAVSDGVRPARRTVDGDVVLGVELPAGRASRVTLVGASAHPHLAGREDIGFGVAADAGTTASVTASYVSGGDRVSRRTTTAGPYTRLLLPSLLDLPDPFARADLVIDCEGPSTAVFLGSSGITPRQALYRLARGNGVEIGPGPRPQIHNTATTRVSYVEEMPAEEWKTLYRGDASADAWSAPGYMIGKAHELPVEDGSLDFIFSSHVLEHLYNPLGHFEHWRRKLRPGGLVLGVVPSVDGTKDFLQAPTSLLALLEEQRAGGFVVPLSAYERWMRAMQPAGADTSAVARKWFDDRVSIHVHVYDYVTITNLLRHCVRTLGYADYRLLFKPNAKDFAFALKADGATSGDASARRAL